ncbi:Cytochrome C oxidase, cbb3-type, subunit III [Humidesulfovibrio mexicanus]|uniref:Cytochrome C oxidase, cbb3-type, subunit III n=1 Tax=Humidesulfovibrio mexicanus TaxID=147047 RepID=A0A239ASK6_9BACT|nr:c-type cytochrome [Humidesulfovibrio mexicanus]SNR98530.1 Cytochrome C oxidase, cbb3-type, subunit III [Humidesulfovibrio mexicanus]
MKTLALSMTLLLAFALSTALAAEDGKALYTAKCQSCHGADGAKATMSKPLKGQSAQAVVKAMEGYKAKTFGGAKKATMENLASRLSDEQFKALGEYIAKL